MIYSQALFLNLQAFRRKNDMNDDSLITLIFNASVPVQLVMLLLMFASVFSWALMYVKRSYVRQSQAEAKTFEGTVLVGD